MSRSIIAFQVIAVALIAGTTTVSASRAGTLEPVWELGPGVSITRPWTEESTFPVTSIGLGPRSLSFGPDGSIIAYAVIDSTPYFPPSRMPALALVYDTPTGILVYQGRRAAFWPAGQPDPDWLVDVDVISGADRIAYSPVIDVMFAARELHAETIDPSNGSRTTHSTDPIGRVLATADGFLLVQPQPRDEAQRLEHAVTIAAHGADGRQRWWRTMGTGNGRLRTNGTSHYATLTLHTNADPIITVFDSRDRTILLEHTMTGAARCAAEITHSGDRVIVPFVDRQGGTSIAALDVHGSSSAWTTAIPAAGTAWLDFAVDPDSGAVVGLADRRQTHTEPFELVVLDAHGTIVARAPTRFASVRFAGGYVLSWSRVGARLLAIRPE